ncbi:hypothetical protein G5B37_11300 [Rasiella rasia]|uniref:Lipoprotein n=1 Tax=Rasiella rasia TaxID=2744027 RepID=A0A6G6GNG3_9FLAO|nr:hypothetical protein [Rasiella rasia]QIE60125.1 hypothetical protein G5B37_11300 [Rasiella rasia]
MRVIKGNKPNVFMQVAISVSLTLLFGCVAPADKSKNVIGPTPTVEDTTTVVNIPKDELPVIIEPKLPKGAVTANFRADQVPFYAVVDKVDRRRGRTTIKFEKPDVPAIVLNESYGATLETLRFDEFDRDLLLVKSKLKDPVFTKYYLYVLRNNQWKLVVNGFSIHQDNNPGSLNPIMVDANDTNKMKRYYSVFDLDETSSLGYTWRLLQESVPILNR